MEKNQVADLCYHLPEAAHEQLCHARDEIRLLADLTARISDEADHLQLSPNALARCFDRLADQLADALHESFWPSMRDRTGQPARCSDSEVSRRQSDERRESASR